MAIVIRQGVDLKGLHPVMRFVIGHAEKIYGAFEYDLLITSALDREHSPWSFHPFGLAIDFGLRGVLDDERVLIHSALKQILPDFDVVLEATHIHVEIGPELEKRLGFNPIV